jgi:hypothetical protein
MGSHIVAFMLPCPGQMGALGPNWIFLPVGVHLSRVQVKDGIGPRVEPSHSPQPMAHPLENQKQACPFAPEMLRSSVEAAALEGNGHQGSKGSGCGTGPPHGFSSESTALRGSGMVIAECARVTVGRAMSRKHARIVVLWACIYYRGTALILGACSASSRALRSIWLIGFSDLPQRKIRMPQPVTEIHCRQQPASSQRILLIPSEIRWAAYHCMLSLSDVAAGYCISCPLW